MSGLPIDEQILLAAWKDMRPAHRAAIESITENFRIEWELFQPIWFEYTDEPSEDLLIVVSDPKMRAVFIRRPGRG